VTRPNPSARDTEERERHEAALRRLEDLLRDAGPGITVRPAGQRDDEDPDAIEHVVEDPAPEIASTRRAKIRASGGEARRRGDDAGDDDTTDRLALRRPSTGERDRAAKGRGDR
jgi:hypothetical protein